MLAKLSPERKLLLDAAQLLRERGHCKYTPRDEQGRMCAVGAVSYVDVNSLGIDISDREEVCRVYSAAFDLLRKRIGEDVVPWNNADETTAEEVIGALESAGLS